MSRVGVAMLTLLAASACLPAPSSGGGAPREALIIPLRAKAAGTAACSGAVGECGVDEAEELGLAGDGVGVGEALRRSMVQRQPSSRYISYAALRADQVPCNRRGRSYYTHCASQERANPYRRGCSAITPCQRNTN